MIASVPLLACGGGDGDGDFTVDPNGTDTGFVAASISIPTSSGDADNFALDLDGNGSKDNTLGQNLGLLAGMGIDLQTAVSESVDAGSVIILANLKATALDNASGVGMTFYLGQNPSTQPCTDENDPTTCGNHLDGSTSFDVAPGSPADAIIGGNLIGGVFETRAHGNVPLQLELVAGQPTIDIDLIGARTTFTVSGGTLTGGILSGAITADQATNNILPVVINLVQTTIAEDCTLNTTPMCCPDGSTGKTLFDLFDRNDPNGDCMVADEQISGNSIVASLLAPDIDLLDENGDFNPRSDEVNDSISLGLGFTGVGATFTP